MAASSPRSTSSFASSMAEDDVLHLIEEKNLLERVVVEMKMRMEQMVPRTEVDVLTKEVEELRCAREEFAVFKARAERAEGRERELAAMNFALEESVARMQQEMQGLRENLADARASAAERGAGTASLPPERTGKSAAPMCARCHGTGRKGLFGPPGLGLMSQPCRCLERRPPQIGGSVRGA
mmetsp:Transcript_45883/g.99710  ORF Transcript_45883/g.99710 Transcript_45883/m.99710 type:complete len:182 (+) Transcript_45883:49-594(+)